MLNSSDRAQTAFDFLAGVTVFLVTVAFVLSFVPGMFQPFESDTGANMVAADRSAALLASAALVENVTAPGVLNETCTAEFFDADGDVEECPYDADAGHLPAALGLDETTGVNVTIEDSSGVLSVTGDGGSVDTAAGRAPPVTAEVVVGERIVIVDGERGTLHVRVW